MKETFLKFAKLTGVGHLLDVGCGPGRDVRFFVELGYNVTGVDLSEEMLKMARIEVPEAEFFRTNIINLKLDKQFDSIMCNAVMHTVPKKYVENILTNFYALLKDEGWLLVETEEGEGESMEYDKRYNVNKYRAYFTETEFVEHLTKAGFVVKDSQIVNSPNKTKPRKWMHFICQKN